MRYTLISCYLFHWLDEDDVSIITLHHLRYVMDEYWVICNLFTFNGKIETKLIKVATVEKIVLNMKLRKFDNLLFDAIKMCSTFDVPGVVSGTKIESVVYVRSYIGILNDRNSMNMNLITYRRMSLFDVWYLSKWDLKWL